MIKDFDFLGPIPDKLKLFYKKEIIRQERKDKILKLTKISYYQKIIKFFK